MKNVHEPDQRRIVSISLTVARELGQMLRQRTIWTEQAEKIHVHPDDGIYLLDLLDAGGSKRQ